jgi:hypothetical protein
MSAQHEMQIIADAFYLRLSYRLVLPSSSTLSIKREGKHSAHCACAGLGNEYSVTCGLLLVVCGESEHMLTDKKNRYELSLSLKKNKTLLYRPQRDR